MLQITTKYEGQYDCPSQAVLVEKGMKTKELYIMYKYKKNTLDKSTYASDSITKFAMNDTCELSIKISGYVSVYLQIVDDGKSSTKRIYDEDGDSIYYYIIKSDNPLEILLDLEDTVYCIPEPPPPEIIPLEKLPEDSTLINIVEQVEKTKTTLDSCRDKLAYILTSKGATASKEDKMSILIDKVNNLEYKEQPVDGNMLIDGIEFRDTVFDYIKYNSSALSENDTPVVYVPPILKNRYLKFVNNIEDGWINTNIDLSENKNQSILLYKNTEGDNEYYYVYSKDKIYANYNISHMFNINSGESEKWYIHLENLNTEFTENMSYLFYKMNYNGESTVLIYNLDKLNLEKVTNIKRFFLNSGYTLIGDKTNIVIRNNNINKYNEITSGYDNSIIYLDYIDDTTKKMAETIVSQNNSDYLKIGNLVD